MTPQVAEAVEPTPPTSTSRLSLNDKLALIGLMSGTGRKTSDQTAMGGDLFADLSDLLNTTVSGAKIDRLRSSEGSNGFKVFEINAESGENLGRLNMLYLKKPVPCYYLVYVEVAPPFRNKGLGTRVLKAFRDFLDEKSTIGILDNIIPEQDPTYDIYRKLHWLSLETLTGSRGSDDNDGYMVYIPPSCAGMDLKDVISRLVHHVKRKRHAIDMRDNELMVQRTIEEFKDLYAALVTYFRDRLTADIPEPFMRFMFTRFVTKLLGFRRRIGQLVGYTGGESMEQIVVDPAVLALPIQSYAPRELADQPSFESGDGELWWNLPEVMRKHPARIIESLANYRRPSLVTWLDAKGLCSSDMLTIGDLLDLGFDPTRLKEISLDGEDYIVERLQPRMLGDLERSRQVVRRLATDLTGLRIKNTRISENQPLLVIRDRGNAYVLRRKIEGIHWEEAVAQLQTTPSLKVLNESLGLDAKLLSTVRKTSDWLRTRLHAGEEHLLERFSFFVSWNIETNQPKMVVEFSSSYLECVWIS
jgi:hypothetical protein